MERESVGVGLLVVGFTSSTGLGTGTGEVLNLVMCEIEHYIYTEAFSRLFIQSDL